jgi:hypothetical protein
VERERDEVVMLIICAEQHRQRRAKGKASGVDPTFIQGRRQDPLRHAKARLVNPAFLLPSPSSNPPTCKPHHTKPTRSITATTRRYLYRAKALSLRQITQIYLLINILYISDQGRMAGFNMMYRLIGGGHLFPLPHYPIPNPPTMSLET